MKIRRNSPAAVHEPHGGYSHSTHVPSGTDLLFVSGQLGIDRNGNVLNGVAAQTRQAMTNLKACLEAEGMALGDVVKLTIHLTDPSHIDEHRVERNAMFDGLEFPTATLLIVAGLAAPGLLVEIDAVAAKASSSVD